MKRKEFVKHASAMALLLANGNIISAAGLAMGNWHKTRVALRFVVASDGHYGQKDTPYASYFQTLVSRVNEEHAKNPFAFCMVNGDIIHDDKKYFAEAKMALDHLTLPYYVSQGNHDHATPAEWQSVWNIPVNHDFSLAANTFLIGTTSDEKGTYLCPNLDWFATQLEQHRQQQNIFIFIHINPGKLTANAVDCPGFFELLSKYKNVKAVFNGHDHDEAGIKTKNGLPFIFDTHFGGNWGTAYRGFRVVELMEDGSLLTYLMNPLDKINETTI